MVPHPYANIYTRTHASLMAAYVRVVVSLLVELCWCVQLSCSLPDCWGEDCSSTTCSAHVTVELDSSADCGELGESVLNSTCNSLQAVLNGLALVSGYDQDDCITVHLSPGAHTLTRPVTITQSVVIAGRGGVAGTPAQPQASNPPTDEVRRPLEYPNS